MKVTVVDATGMGTSDPARYAANILVMAKSTRLQMSPQLKEEIESWPWSKVEQELDYISKTIPSSHEAVSYTILVEGVSRGFTHQFVRSRHLSFYQQTMRVLDVSTGPGWSYLTGPTIKAHELTHDMVPHTPHDDYALHMHHTDKTYKRLIERGVAIEDARGVLPTNILTNIMATGNLRTWGELTRKRASSRTQGEYREVVEAVKAAIIAVHPWTELFFNRTFDRAAMELELKVLSLLETSIGAVTKEEVTRMIKLIDQMRATA